jgi:uncharacterized protein YecE (DUF72 family)
MIKVGCCGFPIKREIYYEDLPLVEIQQTFYHLPQITTGRRWKEEAPPNFEFTMKAWQLITHDPSSPTYRRLRMNISERMRECYGFFKGTEEVDAAWLRTVKFAKAVGANKILFQSPRSFKPTEDHVNNMKQFFKKIERNSFRFIWEPRGEWEDRVVENLCEELGLLPCLDPFGKPLSKRDLVYVRLHGKTGYRYSYSEEDLLQLFDRVRSYPEAYLLFNNLNMYENAQYLNKLLSKIAA